MAENDSRVSNQSWKVVWWTDSIQDVLDIEQLGYYYQDLYPGLLFSPAPSAARNHFLHAAGINKGSIAGSFIIASHLVDDDGANSLLGYESVLSRRHIEGYAIKSVIPTIPDIQDISMVGVPSGNGLQFGTKPDSGDPVAMQEIMAFNKLQAWRRGSVSYLFLDSSLSTIFRCSARLDWTSSCSVVSVMESILITLLNPILLRFIMCLQSHFVM